ncbi:MAG: hypothetical protein JJ899_00085 [Alphaproteobacteria bacterium]|nr:hypothetical protein [Alphaproteobacteria bacterium]
MDDALAVVRLLAAVAAAGGVLYGVYRGLRWHFPRLGARRAGLVVALTALVLASVSASVLRTGNAACLQHENTALLYGERVIRIDERQTARPAPPVGSEPYSRVVEACRFLEQHCALDAAEETDTRARAICVNALAGRPLDR